MTESTSKQRLPRPWLAFALSAGCLAGIPVASRAETPPRPNAVEPSSTDDLSFAEWDAFEAFGFPDLQFASAGEPPADRPDGPPPERRRRPRPPRDADGNPPPPADAENGDRPPPPPPDDFDPDMPRGPGFDRPPGPPHGPPRGDHDGPPRPGDLGHGPRGPHRSPMQLFMPRPQDWEPLSDGEREKLIQFAKEKLPLLGQRLERADDGNAMFFNRRFARDIAPHLRMLQRVYAEDQAMGDLYRRHAEAFFRMQVLRISLRRAGDREAGRQRIEQDARKLFAEMVEVERAVIDRTLQKTAQQSETEIATRLETLLIGDEALDQSPPVRSAIRAYRAATTDDEKAERREIVRTRLAKEAEIERDGLQRMRDRLTDEGEQEVDRRVERLLKSADRPFRRPGPPGDRPPGPPRDRREPPPEGSDGPPEEHDEP